MEQFIGSVIKMSEYYKNHKEELERIAKHYENSPNRELQYRAKCIRQLLNWESVVHD
jgi:hypothetical protein